MNAEKKEQPRNRIVYGMPRAKYDAEDRMNWSRLKVMAKSPAHFRHNLVEQRTDTDALRIGRATHLHVYEPERVQSAIAVWGGGRRYGNEWEAFTEENAGRELLTEKEDAQVRAIANAVRSDQYAQKYVSGGKGEPTLLWDVELPEFAGIAGAVFRMKGRPDFLANVKAIVDLKSTVDASPEKFARQSWNFGYHAQGALYVDGHETITGERWPYVLIAVEKTPPHVVQVYVVPDQLLEMGREHYRDLLGRLAFCQSESRWPAYVDGESELQLPSWVVPNEEDGDLTGLGLTFPEVTQENA